MFDCPFERGDLIALNSSLDIILNCDLMKDDLVFFRRMILDKESFEYGKIVYGFYAIEDLQYFKKYALRKCG